VPVAKKETRVGSSSGEIDCGAGEQSPWGSVDSSPPSARSGSGKAHRRAGEPAASAASVACRPRRARALARPIAVRASRLGGVSSSPHSAGSSPGGAMATGHSSPVWAVAFGGVELPARPVAVLRIHLAWQTAAAPRARDSARHSLENHGVAEASHARDRSAIDGIVNTTKPSAHD
jgi:hypothetical protein